MTQDAALLRYQSSSPFNQGGGWRSKSLSVAVRCISAKCGERCMYMSEPLEPPPASLSDHVTSQKSE
uniref:Uncharacterized protein n=1 Tax=Anguilla anguilla TaxID=7936 RepID=A0A0E9S143_ANGAN